MADVVDLVIIQESEGEIRWEDWWVRRNGHTRQAIPTFDDYLGFIDFDLTQNGLPRLSWLGDKIVLRRVQREKEPLARQVVEYHGFKAQRLS